MGNNVCKTDADRFSNYPQKFWKEIESKKELGDEAKEKVKLTISISKANSSKTYHVSFSRSNQENGTYKSEGQTTEIEPSDEGNIEFPTTFIMDYFFERQQFICFTVHSGSKSEQIKTTLGNVMGSRKQFFQKELSNGEVLGVQGQGLAGKNDQYALFSVTASGKKAKDKTCFFINYCGTQSNPSDTILYKSEALVGENITFASIFVPVCQLAPNGDHTDSIVRIEVYDCKSRKKIGEFTNCLASFIASNNSITLEGNGTITIKCQLRTRYNFLD